MGRKGSLAVLFSLLLKLKKSSNKEDLIEKITSLLINENVCSLEEVENIKERYMSFISDLEKKINSGVSYKTAYKGVAAKYPEFTHCINLN